MSSGTESGHILGPEATLPAPAAAAKAGAIAGGIAIHVDLAPIKTGAFVGIGEQVIGVGDFREPLPRLGVILIAIGMQLLGQLAIGGLDVLLACAAGHAQNGVRIFCHPP